MRPYIDLGSMFSLDQVEENTFRVEHGFDGGSGSLYGGLIAGQSLRAAAHTVPDGFVAHSLHGYYLRRGDSDLPITYRVERDRDGRSFSARRVVALQNDKVIFNLSCSFNRVLDGYAYQEHAIPDPIDPDDLTDYTLEHPLLGCRVRISPQDDPEVRFPTMFWVRPEADLAEDSNVQACSLAYISDAFSGLARAPHIDDVELLSSLDHAMWFYTPVLKTDWVLVELLPEATAGGRGTYSGRLYARDGRLIAGMVQESQFR